MRAVSGNLAIITVRRLWDGLRDTGRRARGSVAGQGRHRRQPAAGLRRPVGPRCGPTGRGRQEARSSRPVPDGAQSRVDASSAARARVEGHSVAARGRRRLRPERPLVITVRSRRRTRWAVFRCQGGRRGRLPGVCPVPPAGGRPSWSGVRQPRDAHAGSGDPEPRVTGGAGFPCPRRPSGRRRERAAIGRGRSGGASPGLSGPNRRTGRRGGTGGRPAAGDRPPLRRMPDGAAGADPSDPPPASRRPARTVSGRDRAGRSVVR
ncbi:hypothetical protein JD81_01362 [Micromonospora sagamiensis]|uniref:Uncharacterized protein n=1 Tax=Micromonospora sagamiensis TaxID=47875 RepID=A0A562WC79_9ACTN|nr:hypothetical protein JD81_01362 [Micromonospora sagamiensis]